jgi:hypothetical protein
MMGNGFGMGGNGVRRLTVQYDSVRPELLNIRRGKGAIERIYAYLGSDLQLLP